MKTFLLAALFLALLSTIPASAGIDGRYRSHELHEYEVKRGNAGALSFGIRACEKCPLNWYRIDGKTIIQNQKGIALESLVGKNTRPLYITVNIAAGTVQRIIIL